MKEMTPEGQCDTTEFNRCHMREWLTFLQNIRHLSADEQIRKVNGYANRKEYILDLENYGLEDYWATPLEVMGEGRGDCEDFAIAKYITLVLSGVEIDKLHHKVSKVELLRLFPDFGWEKEVRWERTAMMECPSWVKLVG